MADSEGDNNFLERQSIFPSESDYLEELGENMENPLFPTELLTKFLSCIMIKDYEKAFNYCNQILTFEPNNSTAQEFYPLILQKLEMKLEESTSESSDTNSTISSGSFENGFFQNDITKKPSEEARNNCVGLQSSNVLDAFNDFIALNASTPKTEITNENKEIFKSNMSFQTKLENPSDSKKGQSKSKPSRNEAQLSSKQIKKKITLKSNDCLKTKEKKIKKSREEKQKVQATTSVSQQEPSSKILLQPSKTMTFPKHTPPHD